MNKIFNILLLVKSNDHQELITLELIALPNYQLTFITDPAVLPAAIEKQSYDVLIIDDDDEHIDPFTVLAKIKNLQPAMKRVIISKHLNYKYIARGISEVGVTSYIKFPWGAEYLKNYLQMLYRKTFLTQEEPQPWLIIIADWDQEKGTQILAQYPRDFPYSPKNVAFTCFSASVGSFGIENEFESKPITLPLTNIHRTARIHFDTRLNMGNPQPFGIFVLSQNYSKTTETMIDEAVTPQLKNISEQLYYSPEIAVLTILQQLTKQTTP